MKQKCWIKAEKLAFNQEDRDEMNKKKERFTLSKMESRLTKDANILKLGYGSAGDLISNGGIRETCMPWRVFLFVAVISCGLWPAMRLL